MMVKRFQAMLRERRGFTLIELMVVVVIIGILVAVAIPQFTGQAEKAKRGKAKADLKTIGTAVELYYTENNDEAPPNLEALVTDKYLRAEPKDPWGKSYSYSKETRGNIPFTLYYTENDQPVHYPEGLELE